MSIYRSHIEKYRSQLGLQDYKLVNCFTFEDWKDDRIPTPQIITSFDIVKVVGKNLPNYDLWIEPILENIPHLIDKKEAEKIRQEKCRIYDIIVEMCVDAYVWEANSTLKSLNYPDNEEFINNEIEKLENVITSNEKGQVLRGQRNLEIVTPKIRQRILELYEFKDERREDLAKAMLREISGIYNSFSYKGLLKAHVEFKFLKKLREKLTINKIDQLIKIFVWEKFKPKEHEKKIIEDYLKEWKGNQEVSYPRATTVRKLKDKYPKLQEISGSVIKNWEDGWKKFKESGTENS